ncbi:hypothetical protein [Adhaeribacter terreus]|uniref:Gliding motility-associated protein GldM N-terminal domain-containing protein n=1 Tax=Adhaeribacter terreus TaxID=529703 RepID=A0ABW0ED13_9BACT
MEARRIRTVLFFIASIFLFSCQRKEDNRLAILALQTACKDTWADIEALTGSIRHEVEVGGNRKADIRVLDLSKRISEWKNPVLPTLSVSGLKQFSDSTYNSTLAEKLEKADQEEWKRISTEIGKATTYLPLEIKSASDSLKIYQILYLILRQELLYHSALAARVGGNDWFTTSINSQIHYKAGDTVKTLISLSRFENDNIKYRAEPIRIYLNDTLININSTTEYIGKVTLIKFPAIQKGTYKIEGTFITKYPASRQQKIAKILSREFNVE